MFPTATLHRASHCIYQLTFFTRFIIVPSLPQLYDTYAPAHSHDGICQTRGFSSITPWSISDATMSTGTFNGAHGHYDHADHMVQPCSTIYPASCHASFLTVLNHGQHQIFQKFVLQRHFSSYWTRWATFHSSIPSTRHEWLSMTLSAVDQSLLLTALHTGNSPHDILEML